MGLGFVLVFAWVWLVLVWFRFGLVGFGFRVLVPSGEYKNSQLLDHPLPFNMGVFLFEGASLVLFQIAN